MKDLAPRTGVIRAPYTRPPLVPLRPTFSAAIPAPLHPTTSSSSTTTRVNNPIDSRFLCTQIRRGRSGPGPVATTGTSSKTTKRRRTMIKLTAAGITDSTLHTTRASLRHGTSPSGDMYITPAPADLIRWKHHQFHPQPPSPLLTIPSDLLPLSSSPDMSYHHSSMSRPVLECRYCSPGRTFDDWRPLAIHEACDHADILNRIPCPADGCDKHYAQLKYLITHYNIHSGRLTHCPKCQKGYTDPSRASRCRQSHDRHFRCPRCDYSNARADLVKQHCKKKHPTLGDLTTSQLESEPSPISEPQACPGDSSSSSFVFHAQPTPVPSAPCVNLDPALDSDEQQGLPTSAPPVSRYALAQAAEMRRQQMIVELRASHVAMSGLPEEQFDLALPEYPIKSGSSTTSSSSSSPDHATGIVGATGSTNSMYIQGTNDEFFSGFENPAPTATHHHHQHHAQQQHTHQHQGTMSAPTTPTRGSPVGSYHHMQSTTTTPVHELSAPSWHDATTTTTGAQTPSSSLGGLIPATTHHQHHYAQGGANYQLATAPAGHHHPHHQHHPHHAAHPHHSPSSSSASYQTRPPLHPSGYPGPPHSSPSRSSSIGSYYSPTSPAGWAADPALGLMGTGTTTTTTTASAGSAYPASTTTPPAMEYVGGQAWTQSSTTAAGAGGPQEYSTLSNFQGQHAHHRRDYSI